MMKPLTPRWVVPVFAMLVASSVAFAQPVPPPPPLPRDTAPLGPAPAQPPLPALPPGAIVASPNGAEVRAGDAAPSRWKAELEALDADLRLRLLTAHEPPAAWLAGELDSTDIEAQVRHFAEARIAAPQEGLYQASLATACLVRVRPPLPTCEAVDRLADWARRDVDNGLPSILLADRARQRGEFDSASSHLEEAAAAPRFDDYWSQGALQWWSYLRPLRIDVDAAARARAAASYASERDLAWAPSLRALCVAPPGRNDRMKLACARLGDAMMLHGATFALRRAGARIAETNAVDAGARTAAQARHARIIDATARCAQGQPDFAAALESADAAIRARGIEQFGAWASAQARSGEVGACEGLTRPK